jgi:hypothetical protein
MPITLKNDDVELTVEWAGERYRNSRFDWNGTVTQARYRGVTMLGEEKPPFHRNPTRFGRGLHNEFGIKRAIGYDAVSAGGWFTKIGIGWLKRDEKPYFFYTDYDIESASFERESSSTCARFLADSSERGGYAWRYEKEIEAFPNGFAIRYRLENAGSLPLETDEYVHNFLCVAGDRMGPAYSLSFPWTLDPASFVETVNPDGALAVSPDGVGFARGTDKQFYLGGLSGGRRVPASWRLAHAKTGISLSEEGNFETDAAHVWGWKRVVSPELFFSFSIAPGESVSWERRYRVSGAL